MTRNKTKLQQEVRAYNRMVAKYQREEEKADEEDAKRQEALDEARWQLHDKSDIKHQEKIARKMAKKGPSQKQIRNSMLENEKNVMIKANLNKKSPKAQI